MAQIVPPGRLAGVSCGSGLVRTVREAREGHSIAYRFPSVLPK